MNILITGCNGQLGNEMQLLETEHPEHEWFNTDVAELDITNGSNVRRFINDNAIDGVVNCAAYTAVDKAEDNKQLCHILNAEAPGLLASAIQERGGWMIQISTDYVFDGTAHRPYVENDAVCPNSTYGITKLEGEDWVLSKCTQSVVIRTSWLYSTFGNNFVKTMLRLGEEREELGVVFDQIGTPTYAHDLASAIMTIISTGIKPGVYHFSNEGVISWYDFAKAIHRIGDVKCRVRPLHTYEYKTAAKRPYYSVLDKTKIKTEYGVEIPYWEESLRQCIEKLKK